MLSHEDNELLTRTGPGTPMGELLRRYWIPVVESKELEPGGRVKRGQLRGEDAGMRCACHAWRFGLDGQCQEMPSEPPESSFASRVKQTAYPCAEAGGV